jgi:hypothetical protein
MWTKVRLDEVVSYLDDNGRRKVTLESLELDRRRAIAADKRAGKSTTKRGYGWRKAAQAEAPP